MPIAGLAKARPLRPWPIMQNVSQVFGQWLPRVDTPHHADGLEAAKGTHQTLPDRSSAAVGQTLTFPARKVAAGHQEGAIQHQQVADQTNGHQLPKKPADRRRDTQLQAEQPADQTDVKQHGTGRGLMLLHIAMYLRYAKVMLRHP